MTCIHYLGILDLLEVRTKCVKPNITTINTFTKPRLVHSPGAKQNFITFSMWHLLLMVNFKHMQEVLPRFKIFHRVVENLVAQSRVARSKK